MDKFRDITNLTDKLSIQRATNLMDQLSRYNLLENTISEWKSFSGWGTTLGEIAISNNDDCFSANAIVKSSVPGGSALAVYYTDKNDKALNPWPDHFDSDGNAPLNTGNLDKAYRTSGYSSEERVVNITVTNIPKNCTHIHLIIANYSSGDCSYKEPMLVRGTTQAKWTPKYIVGGN